MHKKQILAFMGYPMENPTYGWLILADHIGEHGAGVMGPAETPLSSKDILEHPDKKRFKMYDDDGNLYFEGYMVHGTDYEGRNTTGYEPLEDFGIGYAGAVRIVYDDRCST